MDEKEKLKDLEKKVEALEKTRSVLMDKLEFYQNSMGRDFLALESRFTLSKKIVESEIDKENLTKVLGLQSHKLNHILRSLPGIIIVLDQESCIKEVYPGVNFPKLSIRAGDLLRDIFCKGGCSGCDKFERDFFKYVNHKDFKRFGLVFYETECEILSGSICLEVGLSAFRGSEIVLSMRDITEDVKTRRALREQEIQMIHATNLAALGEMASGIAHEINNPLTVLSFRAEFLMNQIKSGEVDADVIKDNLILMKKMMDSLSKTAVSMRRLSRDSKEEPKSEVLFYQVLDDVKSVSSHKFYQGGVELSFHIADDLYERKVLLYPVQLSQVLINLLNNAYDAVEELEKRSVEVSASINNGGDLIIKVKDSGPGIPKEIQEKIFNPFFTTKASDKGTGIGLGLCKTIVTKHDGRFYLDDSEDSTCFVIDLPKVLSA